MEFGKRMTPLEKEWAALLKSEARFLQKKMDERPSFLNEKVEKLVPEKLQETLNLAFYKAFLMVFEKGTGLIEKTYRKEKQEYDYKVNCFAADLKESRKNIRAFSKKAGASRMKNLVVSGVEGIGTGFFGIGVPDIPLFTGMILKSIYEIAGSYGYEYDSEQERIFILKLIKTSLEFGKSLEEGDRDINRWLETNLSKTGDESGGRGGNQEEKAVLIRETADKLSGELLYMKFIQGLPVIGVVGGVSDSIYLKKITDYAGLKYKRRFLLERKN